MANVLKFKLGKQEKEFDLSSQSDRDKLEQEIFDLQVMKDLPEYKDRPDIQAKMDEDQRNLQESLKSYLEKNIPDYGLSETKKKAQGVAGNVASAISTIPGVGSALRGASSFIDWPTGIARTGSVALARPDVVTGEDIQEALLGPFGREGATSGKQFAERIVPPSYKFEKEPIQGVVQKPGSRQEEVERLGTALDFIDPFLIKGLVSSGVKTAPKLLDLVESRLGSSVKSQIPRQFRGATARQMQEVAIKTGAGSPILDVLKKTGAISIDPIGESYEAIRNLFKKNVMGKGAGVTRPGLIPAEQTAEKKFFMGTASTRDNFIKNQTKKNDNVIKSLINKVEPDAPVTTLSQVMSGDKGFKEFVDAYIGKGVGGTAPEALKAQEEIYGDFIPGSVKEWLDRPLSESKRAELIQQVYDQPMSLNDLQKYKSQYQKKALDSYAAQRAGKDLKPTQAGINTEAYEATAKSFRREMEDQLDKVEPGLGAYVSQLNAESAGLLEAGKKLNTFATKGRSLQDTTMDFVRQMPLAAAGGLGAYGITKGAQDLLLKNLSDDLAPILKNLSIPEIAGMGTAASLGTTLGSSIASQGLRAGKDIIPSLLRQQVIEEKAQGPLDPLEQARRQTTVKGEVPYLVSPGQNLWDYLLNLSNENDKKYTKKPYEVH